MLHLYFCSVYSIHWVALHLHASEVCYMGDDCLDLYCANRVSMKINWFLGHFENCFLKVLTDFKNKNCLLTFSDRQKRRAQLLKCWLEKMSTDKTTVKVKYYISVTKFWNSFKRKSICKCILEIVWVASLKMGQFPNTKHDVT